MPDLDRTSDVDYRKAIADARRRSDYSGAWVDFTGEPSAFDDADVLSELNDKVILTLAFTGDLARHEEEARRAWGGPLCVVEFERTYRELRRMQDEVGEIGEREFGLEVLSTDGLEFRNVVEIYVLIIDAATQKKLDDRYGAGVVEVTAQLRPVP